MTLRIYSDAIEMVTQAYKAAEVIEMRDADLARQLRRSSSSVPLNLAEGSYSHKGNRKARYFTALGSANEHGHGHGLGRSHGRSYGRGHGRSHSLGHGPGRGHGHGPALSAAGRPGWSCGCTRRGVA